MGGGVRFLYAGERPRVWRTKGLISRPQAEARRRRTDDELRRRTDAGRHQADPRRRRPLHAHRRRPPPCREDGRVGRRRGDRAGRRGRRPHGLGAHVPQKRSGTLRCRTLSATEGPDRTTETRTTISVRIALLSQPASRNLTPNDLTSSSPQDGLAIFLAHRIPGRLSII